LPQLITLIVPLATLRRRAIAAAEADQTRVPLLDKDLVAAAANLRQRRDDEQNNGRDQQPG
jgi:hypothetical protein